ncbi:CRISPR-associated helicase Cas3, core [Streptomyces sp. SPB074]|nr:CRISPR-associated helicase Cas3, core [Streptomyces sp. SPB074]
MMKKRPPVAVAAELPCRHLWGKADGLDEAYPLVCHLFDTGAVVGALWDGWIGREQAGRLAASAGVEPDGFRSLLCFWAALHDIGKISVPFQKKVTSLFDQLLAWESGARTTADEDSDSFHHSAGSHWLLPALLAEIGYPADRRARRHLGHHVAQLLGGHHGIFHEEMDQRFLRNPRGLAPGLGGGFWEEQARRHVRAALRVTQPVAPLAEMLPAETAVIVCGLIVLADWLASQADFIKSRMPDVSWLATESALDEHWRSAVAAAPAVLAEAGLRPAAFKDASFAEMFAFEPNDLQSSLLSGLPDELTGPGMILLTAPTGDGKTEGALAAAVGLARASGATGLGVVLPTMATTDAAHRRVAAFCAKAFAQDGAVTKVHSMAWLSRDAEVDAATAGTDATMGARADVAAPAWLSGRYRPHLAPAFVATIDQVLSAVLPVRYNVLRHLAVSGKVLVIDEAHAYGPWMHALLLRLLEWLGAHRVPVVVMSATLAGETASSLLRAYRRGSAPGLPAPADDECAVPYPGWRFVAADGRIGAPHSFTTPRRHTLQIRTHAVPFADDPSAARLAKLRKLLEPVFRDGGNALVVCTTVADAQDTTEALREYAEEQQGDRPDPVPVATLHSRFAAHDRFRLSARCEADYGPRRPRDGSRTARPTASILVATQVVEQSLDLDFDMLITDHAPLALLLQRAGRCCRHAMLGDDPHAAHRPSWWSAHSTGGLTEVRIEVLDLVGKKGGFPGAARSVYGDGPLLRTRNLLAARAGTPLRVPEDVQGAIDDVYADDFSDRLALTAAATERVGIADRESKAGEAVETQLAGLVAISSPADVGSDLSELSRAQAEVSDDLVATRFGADSGRVVCVYDVDGRWFLDAAGTVPAPGIEGRRPLTREQARVLAEHVVPVSGGLLAGDLPDLLETPPAWRKNATVRAWRPLAMRRVDHGQHTARLTRMTVAYAADLGLYAVARD